MRKALHWFWKNGIVSTFMTGLFVLLPLVITVAIMSWVGGIIYQWLGPDSVVGQGLENLGVTLIRKDNSRAVGMVIGWCLVLGGIWLVGLYVKAVARQRAVASFNSLVDRIPVINSIYRTVSQVVGMLKKDKGSDMEGMCVVYCGFGDLHGGGFLALLASPQQFDFAGQPCYTVYIPTSPLPMSGAIVFVPVDKVKRLEMTVDDLTQIYFSLGMMSGKVIPAKYAVPL